jgi:hypothetical protein
MTPRYARINSTVLYADLSEVAAAMPVDTKHDDATEIAFHRATITAILQARGVREVSIQRAINHFIEQGILEQREDGFHMVANELTQLP